MIKVSPELCNTCGVCMDICPNIVFESKDDSAPGTIIAANYDLCCNCGHCVIHCPQNAIRHLNISQQQIVQKTDPGIPAGDIERFIMARRSTRCFKPDAISKDKIESLIHVATNAGSASNLQSECFIVVENQDLQNRLEKMAIDILWNKGLKYATDHSIIGKLLIESITIHNN